MRATQERDMCIKNAKLDPRRRRQERESRKLSINAGIFPSHTLDDDYFFIFFNFPSLSFWICFTWSYFFSYFAFLSYNVLCSCFASSLLPFLLCPFIYTSIDNRVLFIFLVSASCILLLMMLHIYVCAELSFRSFH